jgi:carboxymethylenebutenolidase
MLFSIQKRLPPVANSGFKNDNPAMKRTSLLAVVITLAAASALLADPPALSPPPSSTTAVAALAASTRHGEWVDVPEPGSDLKIHTWVVYPERADKAPVVIVIHEIFGMSDWVRSLTDALAAQGFLAVAPDLLSGKGPNGGGTESLGDQSHISDAIRKLTVDEDTRMLNAVRDYALAQPSASDKFGCIGFCWGGGTSFSYATQQPKLTAAVVCYGTPPPPAALANIACPILGLYGGADGRISLTVPTTIKTMADLKKSYDPHVYDNAGHGFFRQQTGRDGANLNAATKGWAEAIAFLKKNLEKQS